MKGLKFKLVNRIGLVAIQLVVLTLAVFVFGWLNIYSLFAPIQSSTLVYAQAFMIFGLSYAILTCASFIRMSKKAWNIYRYIYSAFNFFIVFSLCLEVLFCYVFSEYYILFFNLVMIVSIVGNSIIVLKNIDVFNEIRWVLYTAIIVCIIGLFWLSLRWTYFSEPISCSGVSMTTAGISEKWEYVLPRLDCFRMQLY